MESTHLPSVIIVGAGFGGLATAHHLREAGVTDITVLERADEIGGVWRDNTYPGAACDVPSSLYSWSFAPKHDWSHRYARQPEIEAYIREHAEASGLRDLVRTGAEVAGASRADGRWTVRLTSGEELTADVLVTAVGQLSEPAVPALPGLDDFAGAAFHSARWDHDVDLNGKRVAVIGTGASAIQFVPAIAPTAGHTTVFQRSAPYVVPKPDRTYAAWEKRLFVRRPRLHDVARRSVFRLSEQLNKALDADGGAITRVLDKAWHLHLRRQVKDPALRARLVPDYPLGCKRLLFSNDWYPTLVRDDVAVVTDRISAIEPTGIRTGDGVLHEADVIVLGTGFAATRFLGPLEITGRDGRPLREAWAGGARAHLGITVPDFPGLFLLYGPNTNLGGSSIIGMLEAQAGYIAQAVREGSRRGATLAVRADRAASYDDEMQRRLGESVWSSCSSWYREPGGRITTNWPGTVTEYQQRTARLDVTDFEAAAR